MELKKTFLNKIIFGGICLCVIIFPFNYNLISFLRPVDIILVFISSIFVLSNPKISKNQVIIFLLIVAVLMISTLMGHFINQVDFKSERLIFVYKYLLIFFLPWMFLSIIKTEKQIKIINKLLFFIFLSLCAWSYLFNYFHETKNIRSSFPSNNINYKDSHLFSSYLSFFFGVYLFYFKKFFNHNFFLSLLISVNYFCGLIFTGSRTGILLLAIILIIFGISKLINLVKFIYTFNFMIKKKIFITSIIFFVLLFLLMKLNFDYISEFSEMNKNVIIRNLNFNFFINDQIPGRITKTLVAFNEISYSGWIIGKGLNSQLIFYDGIFSMLMAHGGLLLIFLIIIFYYRLLKKITLNFLHQQFLFFFILCIISNLITEYLMVTRYSFPILLILSIFYRNTLVKKSKNKNENIYYHSNI